MIRDHKRDPYWQQNVVAPLPVADPVGLTVDGGHEPFAGTLYRTYGHPLPWHIPDVIAEVHALSLKQVIPPPPQEAVEAPQVQAEQPRVSATLPYSTCLVGWSAGHDTSPLCSTQTTKVGSGLGHAAPEHAFVGAHARAWPPHDVGGTVCVGCAEHVPALVRLPPPRQQPHSIPGCTPKLTVHWPEVRGLLGVQEPVQTPPDTPCKPTWFVQTSPAGAPHVQPHAAGAAVSVS